MAEAHLAQLDLRSMKGVLGVSDAVVDALRAAGDGLATSYAGLWDEVAESREGIALLSPRDSMWPAAEVYRHIEVVETVCAPPARRIVVVDEVSDEVGSLGSLEALLVPINPSFVQMLQGAREAERSDNPDRIRHVAASLRELFTQVLHHIAQAYLGKDDAAGIQRTTVAAHWFTLSPREASRRSARAPSGPGSDSRCRPVLAAFPTGSAAP